jgi:hypothetical protein
MTSHSSVILLVFLIALNATAFQNCFRGSIGNFYKQRDLFMKVEFRNAKISDISSISELCSATFDGPFQWHQQIQRLQSVENFKLQLADRLNNLVSKGIKHCMIVAVDTEKSAKSSVVGFLEIGLLPSPTLANEPTNISNTPIDAASESDGADIEKDVILQAALLSETSEDKESKDLVDHYSNASTAIAEVSGSIAEGEISASLPAAQSVENAAAAAAATAVVVSAADVDADAAAVSVYGSVDPNELVLAAAAAEADRKADMKRDEVPYLGNVAVSEDCR